MAAAGAGLLALGTLTATPASATVWSKNLMVQVSQSPICIKASGSTGTKEKTLWGGGWFSMDMQVQAGSTISIEGGAPNPSGVCEYPGNTTKSYYVSTDDLTNFWATYN
ncbi:hypothetical protein ABTY98_41765 [Streptomyces sp. NPDC096040]|uniref:hypothetical protein n=1 Tax=Streptomyces sp. NPDC096040 TaxID=3155541 RepID=UPI00331E26FF